jgi:hypothetical protein
LVLKKYSLPSTSPSLGNLVVAEIEKVTLGSLFRTRVDTLVFPAPEGEEIINKVPSEDNKLAVI